MSARFVPALALLAITSLAAGGCARREAATRESTPVPVPVSTIEVAAADAAPAADGAAAKEQHAELAEAGPPAGDAGCTITVGAVLAADVFTGVRNSPSRQASRDRLDPKTRAQWDGRDHGVQYLRCRYAIRMNGRSYKFDHVAEQDFTRSGNLDVKKCGAMDTKREAAKSVRESTRECADPHGGAYWGFDLEEADGGP